MSSGLDSTDTYLAVVSYEYPGFSGCLEDDVSYTVRFSYRSAARWVFHGCVGSHGG